MKDLYFIKTNAFYCVVTDDGETRRLLIDCDGTIDFYDLMRDPQFKEQLDENEATKVAADYLLNTVEDDSSFESYSETLDELLGGEFCPYSNPNGFRVIAHITKII